MTTLVRSASLLIGLIVCGLPLAAQNWEVVRAIPPGQSVKVRETNGKEHKGPVTTVTPDAISLRTGNTQVSIERTRVERVQLHSGSRRLRNVAIGAAIGLGVGLLIDQTLGTYLRNESGDDLRAVTYIAPIGIFGALGAAISPYRTIYRAK
jgi:hypothetical protein